MEQGNASALQISSKILVKSGDEYTQKAIANQMWSLSLNKSSFMGKADHRHNYCSRHPTLRPPLSDLVKLAENPY